MAGFLPQVQLLEHLQGQRKQQELVVVPKLEAPLPFLRLSRPVSALFRVVRLDQLVVAVVASEDLGGLVQSVVGEAQLEVPDGVDAHAAAVAAGWPDSAEYD